MSVDNKIFVGIDPSYSSTGVVVINGVEIKPYAFKAGKSDLPFHERIHDLWKQIGRVLPPPEKAVICIEGAAYAAEFNAFMLGELSGALKYILYSNNYKYEVVQPTVLKKYATGSGNAQKHFVAAYVAKKWDFVHASNDVVDAFVLAKIASEGGVSKITFENSSKKSKTNKRKEEI